jgi:hypothetical protein
MVPAKPKDTIANFLYEVAQAYQLKNPSENIKCE